MSVQAQILNLLIKLRFERGLSYMPITHDLSIGRQVTDRLYVMHSGRVVESAPTEEVLSRPRDPYTAALLKSAPRPEQNCSPRRSNKPEQTDETRTSEEG